MAGCLFVRSPLCQKALANQAMVTTLVLNTPDLQRKENFVIMTYVIVKLQRILFVYQWDTYHVWEDIRNAGEKQVSRKKKTWKSDTNLEPQQHTKNFIQTNLEPLKFQAVDGMCPAKHRVHGRLLRAYFEHAVYYLLPSFYNHLLFFTNYNFFPPSYFH